MRIHTLYTLFAASALLCHAATTLATEAITARNWNNHPDIVAVRAVYQADEALKNTGQLKKQQRRDEECGLSRTLYTDVSGKPRLYAYDDGSEDSALNIRLYYDEAGVLRFALVQGKAINDTHMEHRVYFSEKGHKIWEIQKKLKGPGYTFPEQWPDDNFSRDPISAFNKANSCE